MSITNLAFLRARPGREEALGDALLAVIEPSRAEAGCEAYELHRSSEDPALWFMYEVWASQEALAAHFETPHLKQLVAQCAELLDGPMDLRPFTPVNLKK